MHDKLYHSRNKASQYEQSRYFEVFNCFYCDVIIDSEDQLEVHLSTCQYGIDDMWEPKVMYQDVNLFTCENCCAKCRDSEDLERHWTIYHYSDDVPQEHESECFQCDICPLNYIRKIDLEFHKRGCHWGQNN